MTRHSRRLTILQCSLGALLVLLTACTTLPERVPDRAGSSIPPTSTGTGAGSTGATGTASSSSTAVGSPTGSPTSAPTAAPTAAPTSNSLVVVPPGQPLPSEATCAARVHRSSWEPRPDNKTANSSVPTAAQIASLAPWGAAMGLDPKADSLRKQITGNFTGTTDEILQWVACKWGFNPNLVRAEAVVESYWHQSQLGDWTTDKSYCPPGTWTGSGCYQSYGIFQIKWYYFQDSWPMSREDTAFSAEYMYGMLRTCFEGWTTYLKQGTPLPGYKPYAAGDIWGCLGRWFSGWWYTQGAVDYINKVKSALSQQTWLSSGF